jgi:hypothetical protein
MGFDALRAARVDLAINQSVQEDLGFVAVHVVGLLLQATPDTAWNARRSGKRPARRPAAHRQAAGGRPAADMALVD